MNRQSARSLGCVTLSFPNPLLTQLSHKLPARTGKAEREASIHMTSAKLLDFLTRPPFLHSQLIHTIEFIEPHLYSTTLFLLEWGRLIWKLPKHFPSSPFFLPLRGWLIDKAVQKSVCLPGCTAEHRPLLFLLLQEIGQNRWWDETELKRAKREIEWVKPGHRATTEFNLFFVQIYSKPDRGAVWRRQLKKRYTYENTIKSASTFRGFENLTNKRRRPLTGIYY